MQPQGLSLDDEERIKADIERRAAQILDNSERRVVPFSVSFQFSYIYH